MSVVMGRWSVEHRAFAVEKPRTTVDLKQNIRDEVAAISPTMLQRVKQNFQ